MLLLEKRAVGFLEVRVGCEESSGRWKKSRQRILASSCKHLAVYEKGSLKHAHKINERGRASKGSLMRSNRI